MARINWNEPNFGEEEIISVSEVIKNNYVNEGPKTKEFEEEIKKYLRVKYVIITTNATAALYLAIKADAIIKGKKDFEVIVPDMTMIATATAVGWAGGKVIFVDVNKNNMTLDVGKIESKITNKTTAIIPVHILGRAADMTQIEKIAKKHQLTIIEDAAGALGSKLNGKYLGTIGKVGCYSMQSNKIITSGQGGIIVTNDDKYNEWIRRLRDFGRMSNKEFIHQEEGYNLKFNDLSAALGLAQFKKIEQKKKLLISQRERYMKNLKSLKQIKFPSYEDEEIPLWVDVFVERRSELVEFLKKNEIYSRECWPAVHRNPPYANNGDDLDFPNSSFISDNVLWLPNGGSMTDDQIDLISRKIIEFYGN